MFSRSWVWSKSTGIRIFFCVAAAVALLSGAESCAAARAGANASENARMAEESALIIVVP